jgi:hypothetical protein
MSFTDNSDGTITDLVTGLIWQKEDDNITRTWEEAITYCEGLELPAGQTDWRLPNVKELRSIVDNTLYHPSIDQTYFPGTSWHYWSSTYYGICTDTPSAWYVSFSNYFGGRANNEDRLSGLYVRCVRGGK